MCGYPRIKSMARNLDHVFGKLQLLGNGVACPNKACCPSNYLCAAMAEGVVYQITQSVVEIIVANLVLLVVMEIAVNQKSMNGNHTQNMAASSIVLY